MVKFAPSILAADFWRLGEQVKAAEEAGANRFHIDVMDGRFVPNLSLGIPIVEAMRRGTSLPLELHLMIQEPERYVESFIQAGADIVIVHQEATPHLHRTVQLIKHHAKKAGVGLNPSTPTGTIEDILADIDLLLLMTVNPGFGGQRFINSMLPKIQRARQLVQQCRVQCELEADGGVDAETAPLAVNAGADVLVAGTAIFADPDGPKAGLLRLMQAIQ
ncbi:MAG TPA: ribulose-phosphate 3-epimerase [Candidatus Tectomicrobia bacterium]|nr:ribulose-phosphate 3-epimerase [Candidatus Tectomicrobia bacterium]